MNNKLSSIFSDSRVLITGNTGFKGSWLSLWLSMVGAQVFGLSDRIYGDLSHYESANMSRFVKTTFIDIRNRSQLKHYIKDLKPDFIFHLAAQSLVRFSYSNPIETWEINTIGTLNLLDAIKDLTNRCSVVLITSDKCYENLEWEWGYRENDRLGGADPYSASKAAAEIAINSYIRSFLPKEHSISIGIARAGNVIGGGDWGENRIVPDCVKAWSVDEIVKLRNPKATRPWQHVLEPLSGYLNIALSLHQDKSLHGEAFNFGPQSDQVNSVEELVLNMSKYWSKVKWEDVSKNQKGPYESSLLKLNCDKALNKLKWKSNWSFETTVKETVGWYKCFYMHRDHNNILEKSRSQILDYIDNAKSKNIDWAI